MGYRLVIPEKLNKKIIKFDKSVQKILYSYIKKNLLDADAPWKSINRKFKRNVVL